MRRRTARHTPEQQRRSPRLTPQGETAAGGVITAITPQRRRGRYNLYIGGVFALALDAETLAQSKLKEGAVIAGKQLQELTAAALRKRALDTALRLLSSRPRSEQEIRTRLLRHALPPDVVAATIERLREYGYVNDAAFARSWVESRTLGTPRGRHMLHWELRRKGVDVETVTEAVDELDEVEAARQAAMKKARSLRGLTYPDFRNRLAGYLQRRGFEYDVITPIVREVWQTYGQAIPDDEGWIA